jgi:ABC-2 type transport system permease protein
MSWGPQPAWLLLVVFSTSLAATGLAMLIASLAKTETQVAVYGTLLVLILAGLSGSLMPRELMPDEMKAISRFTPHAWALEAYAELLNPNTTVVNISTVLTSCGVLIVMGLVLSALAWLKLRTE